MLRGSVRCMTVAAIFTIACLAANSAFAQRGGFGGPGGGAFGQLFLLENEEVRKELEIVDEQVEKLQELRDKMREQMREQFQGLRDLSDDERRTRFEELRGKMEEQAKDMQKQVDEILMPQQRQRLAQISLQQRLQRAGTIEGLTSGELAEELGITPEQKADMEERAKEAQKELQEKIAKARTEARDKILSGLTAEQKDKIKKLLGDEFQMTQQNRFGQGGQRGQRGGNRGNRGGDQQN